MDMLGFVDCFGIFTVVYHAIYKWLIRTYTDAHKHTCAHTHTYTDSPHTHMHARTHTCTHTHTDTRTQA